MKENLSLPCLQPFNDSPRESLKARVLTVAWGAPCLPSTCLWHCLPFHRLHLAGSAPAALASWLFLQRTWHVRASGPSCRPSSLLGGLFQSLHALVRCSLSLLLQVFAQTSLSCSLRLFSTLRCTPCPAVCPTFPSPLSALSLSPQIRTDLTSHMPRRLHVHYLYCLLLPRICAPKKPGMLVCLFTAAS